jgi:type IX secretion system PorP/SprF family membrane protein
MFLFTNNNAYFFNCFTIKLMINLYAKKKQVDRIRSKIVLYIVLIFCSGSFLEGQDIHFTQFDFNPIFLNPANTGNFIGDWRVAGNFRNQWSGTANPFNTMSVSADMPVYLMGQKIGVGLLFVNDVSGASGLNTNMAYASAGYNLDINNNYFNIGVQVGMVFSSINNSWGLWNHQTGQFDLPNNEPNSIGNSNYLDVNLGGIWKRNINIFEPEVGLNIQHINMPTKTFTSGTDNVPLRMSVYVISKAKITDKIYATPKLYYSGQQAADVTIVGAEGGYNLLGNKSSVKRIFAGVYLRNGIVSDIDAFMVQGGATVGRIDIAVSYDMGLSNLSQSKTMGSFEIALIYKSISTVLNSYSIPCERY